MLRVDRKRLLWVAIPLGAFLWFWFWRANQWTGGDSEQWEREIANGVWWRKRQMLSFACMQAVYSATHALWGWSAQLAINFVSSLAGALSMLLLWRMLGRRGDGAAWAFLTIATAGFTTIFYGHIETYAQPVAALLLNLLALERVSEDRWPPWTIVATFALMMAFHLAALFLLPALIPIVLWETRRRGLQYRPLVVATLPAVAFWFAITRMSAGDGELVGPHFVRPLEELFRAPWVVFFNESIPVKIKFMFWNGGVVLLPALWVFFSVKKHFRDDPATLYLLLYFLCFLGFTAIWNPDAGPKDFDLFCFPWVVACVAAARYLMQLPGRAIWVGLLLGVNFFLWLTRPVVFSDIGHRGHGTLLFETSLDPDDIIILYDDRLHMKPVNRYVREGTRAISLSWPKGKIRTRRAVILRPGETYRARVDKDGLHVSRVDE